MNDPRHAEHRAEAEARWGDTEAYRQSSRRTAKYTKDDWAAIHAELDDIESDFAGAMRAGVDPADEKALAIAERARGHIDRWYYECTPEMHAKVAAMYTADPRFRKHYDDRAEGLAEYVSAAVKANAAR